MMNIIEKIKLIAREELDCEINEEDSLKDCGVDSLSLVNLVIAVEQAFNITFPDDELQPENLVSLTDIVSLTERYL